MINPFYKSDDKKFNLLKGDVMKVLPQFEHKFDMIFADPPYFLSNGGISVQSGKMVSVNKGDWDKSKGFDHINNFNREWLSLCRDKLKDNGTIWISGTYHNIFSIGQLLTELDYRILNIVTWQKTNPPPNLSCKFFTHSTEYIIWARKEKKVTHYYNYELMKQLNGGKQMKDVWQLPAIARWEKSCGKHPTQKPLAVLTRVILASTKPGDWILDPFTGGSTTGIAANLANRRFVGVDQELDYLKISKARKLEIEDETIAEKYRTKLRGFKDKKEFSSYLENEPIPPAKVALGFIRKGDLRNLKTKHTFYFHAIESDAKERVFPSGLRDCPLLYIYYGGRTTPLTLSGHIGHIKSIVRVSKSEIQGKENSKTPFYWKVELEQPFEFNERLSHKIDTKILFDKKDKNGPKQLRDYLPAISSVDRIEALLKSS
jgi:site-specific DNA-methyltransferase (adenine-specific)